MKRLLNMDWKIYQDKIEDNKSVFTQIIKYFTSWINDNVNIGKEDNVSARILYSYCISTPAYWNMLTLVQCYMGCVEEIRQCSPLKFFVPDLRRNQGSIEYLLSSIHSVGKIKQTYMLVVFCNDISSTCGKVPRKSKGIRIILSV